MAYVVRLKDTIGSYKGHPTRLYLDPIGKNQHVPLCKAFRYDSYYEALQDSLFYEIAGGIDIISLEKAADEEV